MKLLKQSVINKKTGETDVPPEVATHIITEYELPNGKKRKRIQKMFPGKSLTQKHLAKDCDVNVIMEKHLRTGLAPHNPIPPKFGDFSEVGSYQESLNMVIQAEDTFMSLNAKTRERFKNNPQELIDFLNDPENLEESYELKLRNRPQPDDALKTLKEISENTKKQEPPKE